MNSWLVILSDGVGAEIIRCKSCNRPDKALNLVLDEIGGMTDVITIRSMTVKPLGTINKKKAYGKRTKTNEHGTGYKVTYAKVSGTGET